MREQSSFFYNLSLVEGKIFSLFLGLKIDNSNNLSGAEQLFKECNGSGALFFSEQGAGAGNVANFLKAFKWERVLMKLIFRHLFA